MIPVGVRVVLNETEARLALYLAKARNRFNRRSGAPDRQIGPQDARETDLEGAAAELALAKVLKVYPDLDVDRRPPFDLAVGGVTIDVKATRYEHGRLAVAPWKGDKPLPDFYALMVGRCPAYRFAGVMRAEHLTSPARLGTLGHGPTYLARQDELTPLELPDAFRPGDRRGPPLTVLRPF